MSSFGSFVNQGRDFNFFQKVAVNWASFGGSPGSDGYAYDCFISFPTQSVMMLNLGSGVVEFSFNGNHVHGELNSANPSVGMTFDNRTISLIWFRLQSGSSGPITISVQAWAP